MWRERGARECRNNEWCHQKTFFNISKWNTCVFFSLKYPYLKTHNSFNFACERVEYVSQKYLKSSPSLYKALKIFHQNEIRISIKDTFRTSPITSLQIFPVLCTRNIWRLAILYTPSSSLIIKHAATVKTRPYDFK